MEDRRRRILSLVDPSREIGLEIGPLAKPIVERSMGRILYSDHRSTEELRQKYAPHADKGALALNDIVEIDLVVPENTSLPAVLGDRGPVDYVVASHVMEHIPDTIGWLNQIADCLHEGGRLCLAVPDKRFTFDHHRDVTPTRELVQNHLLRPTVPTPAQVYDHVAKVTEVDAAAVWSGRPAPATPMRDHGPAVALILAAGVARDGIYHDVHCTVYTPASFAEVIGDTILLGLVPFAFAAIEATAPGGTEFFATLVKQARLNPEERAAGTPVLDRRVHHALPSGRHEGRLSGLRRRLGGDP
jgi:hypothetical protein